MRTGKYEENWHNKGKFMGNKKLYESEVVSVGPPPVTMA